MKSLKERIKVLESYCSDDNLFNMLTRNLDYNKRYPILKELYNELNLSDKYKLDESEKFKTRVPNLEKCILNEIGFTNLSVIYAEKTDAIKIVEKLEQNWH